MRILLVSLLAAAAFAQEQAAEAEARSPYYPPQQAPPPRPYPPPRPQQQQPYSPPYAPVRPGPPPPVAQPQAQSPPVPVQQQPPPPPPQQQQPIPAARPQQIAPGQAAPLPPGPAVPMTVSDTVVTCESRNMRVQFSMSAPFHGIIYPYNHFHNCLLHEGNGERAVTLLLGHGTCANENGLRPDGSFSPVIEHRLMIQWDPEIVEEWDSSIIVRCDRPEDYNKTIRFDLGTLDPAASFISSTHPGPQMWMEIQRGEGPNAPELQGSVFLGEVLTLVFTLADEFFDFDTNVLTCWALDGQTERRRIEWLSPQGGGGTALSHRRYTGEMEVINQGCSAKPKIFGHFYKTGEKVAERRSLTQYAFFKAFRFPTSSRVVIQCNVQVCYRQCNELRPCSESFHPRSSLAADEAASRRRREAPEPAEERVSLTRAIEVHLPEETADLPVGEPPYKPGANIRYQNNDTCTPCASVNTFFIVLISLAALLALLVTAVLFMYLRRGSNVVFTTPTK